MAEDHPGCFSDCSHPLCASLYGVEIVGDGLYVQPSLEGLSFAIRNDVRSAVGGEGTPGGPVLDLKATWKPAFRIAMNYLPGITTRLTWMHLSATDRSSSEVDLALPGLGLESLWVPPMNALILYQNGSLCWDLNLDTIDLEIGKRYAVSSVLSMNPACGFRIARIDQGFHAAYRTPAIVDTVNAGNDFLSIGIRMLLDAEWRVISDWSICARGAAALLYGRFQTHYTSSSPVPFRKIEEKFYRLEPNVECSIGFGWKKCLARGQCLLGFRLSCEGQIFWDQNELRQPMGSDAPTLALQQVRNLTVQGFALRGQIAF
jgi:hypothetical protein